jgi:hypothetical protein
MPDQSPNPKTQPEIAASQPSPRAVPYRSKRKIPTSWNVSTISAITSKRETIKIPSPTAAEAQITALKAAASEKAGEAAIEPKKIDSMETVPATLREIRGKFSQGDMTGLDSIFNKPALEDGEYYLLWARHLCETGEWRKALPFVEKALTVPARAMSPDQLTNEYFVCKAKCFDAAFGEQPTPDRAAAAMEAWYNVKYQFRGMPQDSRFLYANNEIRRISNEVNGK